jgi:hypothetical protein
MIGKFVILNRIVIGIWKWFLALQIERLPNGGLFLNDM